MKRTCQICGQVFNEKPARIKTGRGLFCSLACKGVASRTQETHPCVVCGQLFTANPCKLVIGRRYCSRRCFTQAQSTTRTVKNCAWCGKEFMARTRSRQYCSVSCSAYGRPARPNGSASPQWRGGPITCHCTQCGMEFQRCRASCTTQRTFCSRSCCAQWVSENLVGDKAPRWLGGKSFEPYPTTFNDNFKRRIRERDNYTCALCGASNSTSVHHINYVKDDTTPENCITLCVSCHAKTNHRRGYWQTHFEQYMAQR